MSLYARGRLSADDPPKPNTKELKERKYFGEGVVHQGTTGFVHGVPLWIKSVF
jgi:hypothetical protein